jgi:MFS family permease
VRDPADLTPRERFLSLAAILAMIGVAGMGMGLTGPLYTYAFELAGYSRTMTGLNSAIFAVAILLSAPFVPGLLRSAGLIKSLWISIAIAALSIATFRLTDHVAIWFLSRFTFGIAMTIMFVATEVWINLIAREETRGRALGLYTTCLAGGFAGGLAILYTVGSSGWTPVWITIGLFLAAALPLLPAARIAPKAEKPESNMPILPFLRSAPSALGAALVFGAVEMGILNLLNVFALRAGLSEAEATLMLLITAAGNIIGPLMIGILADRMNRRVLLILCAGVGTIVSFLIPATIDNPLYLYVILFLNGAIITGIYNVGLTIVGMRFQGGALAGANAAYTTLYGTGALIGPFVGGVAMDIWDPNGLMVVFFVLTGAYALFVFGRLRRSARLTGGAA